MTLRVNNGYIHPAGNLLPAPQIITGGEHWEGGFFSQFVKGGLLDLKQIPGVRCFCLIDIAPESDALQKQYGQAVQIPQMNQIRVCSQVSPKRCTVTVFCSQLITCMRLWLRWSTVFSILRGEAIGASSYRELSS